MPQFDYKAKTGPQKSLTGTINAENVDDAIEKILAMGHTPVQVKLHNPMGKSPLLKASARLISHGFQKVPLPVLGVFMRQLADLLEAEVPIIRALELSSRQVQDTVLKDVLKHMCFFVQGGGSLSEAFNQHPWIFSSLQVQMVRYGESSGQLTTVLLHLAELIEKDLEMQKRVQMGLMYPLIILGVGIMTILVLLTFVLPKLTLIFDDFNAALPWPTQLVMGVSNFFADFWLLIAAVLGGGGYYLSRWSKSPAGRLWFDTQIIRVPLLKDFVRDVETSRFSRALATLLASGVPVVNAMESSVVLIGNGVLREEAKKAVVKVKAGSSLSIALKETMIFSDIAISLIAVAEESGHLEKGLFKLTVMSERNVRQTSDVLVTILGPFVLVIVVGIVGFIVVSILLPMLQMNMIIN